MLATAEFPRRSEISRQMLVHGVLRGNLVGNEKRLDAILLQFLGRTPPHSVAQHRLAVLEGLDNGPVAVMVVVFYTLLALAPGMGRESVVPHGTADELLGLNFEDQEGPTAAEVTGNGNAVLGSDCDLHSLASLFSAWADALPPRCPRPSPP